MFTILGSSGFIGSHLNTYLGDLGYKVYSPSRDDPSIFSQPLGNVFYCVGVTSDFRIRPFDTVNAHVFFLSKILQHADFQSLIYLSSTRVYINTESTNETTDLTVNPVNPSDLYNLSKLTGESLCVCSKRKGVKIIRLSNVIGKDFESSNFLVSLIRAGISGEINLETHPESSKDYIYIDDVLKLLLKISLDGKDSIYNVASGFNISNAEILNSISSVISCKVVINNDAPLVSFSPIKNSKIVNEFGFSAISVIDLIPRLIDSFRNYQSQK